MSDTTAAQIRNLLAKQKVQPAITLLIKAFEEQNDDNQEDIDACVLLNSRYLMAKEKIEIHATREEGEVELNQVINGVLDFVNEFEDPEADELIKPKGFWQSLFDKKDISLLRMGVQMLIIMLPLGVVYLFVSPFLKKTPIATINPPQSLSVIALSDSVVKSNQIYLTAVKIRSSINESDEVKLKEIIGYCSESIKYNDDNWEPYNLRAECNLLLFMDNKERKYLNNALSDALSALKYNPDDISEDQKRGFINSTLAQIYSLKGDNSKFYFYVEESLKMGLNLWEYQEQPGFKERKEETKFQDILHHYKLAANQ